MNNTRIVRFINNKFKKGSLCVFCGAGISLHSGIPLASTLIKAVLKYLKFNEEEKKSFLRADLPFESVVEMLFETTDLRPLLKIFQNKEPNLNHILFAKLAAAGILRIFITTNFDTLLEDALKNEGVPFRLIYKEGDLEKIEYSSKDIQVIKLHGTVEDYDSLAITIKRVSNQQLFSSRKKVIAHLFSKSHIDFIVMLGYSFSDRFDISPAIASVDSKSKFVLLIEHSSMPLNRARFVKFNKIKNNALLKCIGEKLRCSTDEFMKLLWLKCIGTSVPKFKKCNTDWRIPLKDWYGSSIKKHGLAVKNYLSGRLWMSAGNYKKANELLDLVIRNHPSPEIEALTYQAIGDNYRDQGDYDRALRYLIVALGCSRTYKFMGREARALASIGVVLEDQKDHFKAISYYKRAMKILRFTDDKELEGKCNGNIGIVYKNLGDKESLKKALRYHEKALRIARELGDKKSEGRTLGNIGITYSDMDQKTQAVQYYREAYAVAEDLRDIRHMGIWAANAGMDLVNINKTEAKKYLETAVRIFNELRLSHYITEIQDSLIKIRKNG